MKVGNNGRFAELDVLRGLAALTVVLSHYTNYGSRYFHELPVDLGHYGYYAVELFYMISGFAIYFTLAKSASLLDFAVSRVTRLYPVYWTTLTLMVAVETIVFKNRIDPSAAATDLWWHGYFLNLTMFQEFLGFGNFDNVYWSLTYELAFYIDMALLFALGLLGRIELVLAPWLGLAALWALLDPNFGATASAPDFVSRILILRYVGFFAAGIMFYRLSTEGPTRLRQAILVAALGLEWLIHGAHDLAVAAALFAIFGLSLTGRLRFLISPVTLWLGAISYPLYLIHRNLGYSTLLRLHENGVPFWIGFLVAGAGCLHLGDGSLLRRRAASLAHIAPVVPDGPSEGADGRAAADPLLKAVCRLLRLGCRRIRGNAQAHLIADAQQKPSQDVLAPLEDHPKDSGAGCGESTDHDALPREEHPIGEQQREVRQIEAEADRRGAPDEAVKRVEPGEMGVARGKDHRPYARRDQRIPQHILGIAQLGRRKAA